MIRIMQFPGTMLYGGVGSVVMNIYRNIDRTKIQFDFCVPREGDGPLDDEIRSMGGRIFKVPQMREKGFRGYIKAVKNVLTENGPYEAVHIHSVHMGALPLIAAKKAGVTKRVYHVHNTMDAALNKIPGHQLLEIILNYLVKANATKRLACGMDAGKYVYGRSAFEVINNAIDTSRFYPYPDGKRRELREQLGFREDEIVVGDVARFVTEKNIAFFIEIAKEEKTKRNNCKFMIVGDGPLKSKVEETAKNAGCFDKFIFTGARKDVENLYNVMDIFCLPSLFEGLPVTMMEAQACGLPCILSENVTNEGKVGIAPFEHLRLMEPIENWVNKIYEIAGMREINAMAVNEAFVISKYEISSIAKQLEDIYLMS